MWRIRWHAVTGQIAADSAAVGNHHKARRHRTSSIWKHRIAEAYVKRHSHDHASTGVMFAARQQDFQGARGWSYPLPALGDKLRSFHDYSFLVP